MALAVRMRGKSLSLIKTFAATATNGVDRKTESASNNAGSNESQNNHTSAHSNGSGGALRTFNIV